MDETEAAVAVAAPVRFERRNASQQSVVARLEKAAEQVQVLSEKLFGNRPRNTIMEQKGLARSVEMLESAVRELQEGLGL